MNTALRHEYCTICSRDVTGADFENSLYAFGQSEKERVSSMYSNYFIYRIDEECVKSLGMLERFLGTYEIPKPEFEIPIFTF